MADLDQTQPFHHDGSEVGVLVAHGFTGSPRSMRPLAQALAEQGYTVRLPRLPGHGTTWQELNRTRWQDWYACIAEQFGDLRTRCSSIVAVGLSMGGTLVTRLAQEQGPGVDGLVLINPAYRVDDRRLRALPVLKYLRASIPAIGNDISKPGQDEQAYPRTPLRALHSQVGLWAEVVRAMPEVTAPILLLRSAQDHVVPASSSQLLLSRISSLDVREVVLENSFHVATLDNDAPRILEETGAFIARVTAPGRRSTP